MAEQLQTMLAEGRYRQYGNCGLEYVRDHHDIKAVIGLYKSILRGNATPAI
jgi:hypothetical protein